MFKKKHGVIRRETRGHLTERSPCGLNDHVLAEDHDKGEDLEEDGGGDGGKSGKVRVTGFVQILLDLAPNFW